MSARRIFARPARIAAVAPYLWMVLFFLVPFIQAKPPVRPRIDDGVGVERGDVPSEASTVVPPPIA